MGWVRRLAPPWSGGRVLGRRFERKRLAHSHLVKEQHEDRREDRSSDPDPERRRDRDRERLVHGLDDPRDQALCFGRNDRRQPGPEVARSEQVWTADDWVGRFGLPFPARATGYGFSSEQVEQVRVPSADLLLEYADAVHDRTAEYLRGLSDDDLDTVVDTRWDPPVTLGVRLVSVLSDDLQHVGQAAFLRGLLTSG